ncbi:biotin/lipoyl-containing protein [Roseiarcus sp.]|uniref:biotin/lipoyl-containing protein n=1 Tax=Roseiarcus sp. TaxID=1969460 RepID=UPI003F9BA6B7
MRIDVKMPDLSATEGSDILVKRWLVTKGARVKRGQPLLEVETDKATIEVESVASGTIAEILAQPDVKVAIGEVIARIEVDA